MRDYTRNQLARRLEWMEEWSKTAPQQPTAPSDRVFSPNTTRTLSTTQNFSH